MRRGIVAAFTGVLMLLAPAAGMAVPESFPVCAAPNWQGAPAIDGDIVVWTDFRDVGEPNFPDLYGYNWLTATEFPIHLDVNIVQSDPDISGNTVVWTDDRAWSTTRYDIWGKNLATGSEFLICNAGGDQLRPAVEGNLVAWEDYRHGDSWYADVYAKNLSTGVESEVYHAVWDDYEADIAWPWVVWERVLYDVGIQIYAKNLQTGEVLLVNSTPGAHRQPSIWGDKVVWTEFRDGNWDIYGYNLTTRTEFAVCTARGHQGRPRIYENTVIWRDSRFGGSHILGKDLSTGREFAVCLGPGNQWEPAIHGTRVVWEDDRNYAVSNMDIYGADLAPAAPDTRTLWVELDSTGLPGQNVLIPVSLDELSGVAGIQFDLDYNIGRAGLLTLVGAHKGAALPDDWVLDFSSPAPDVVRIVAYSPTAAEVPSGSGPVVELEFQVDVTASMGEQCTLHPHDIVLSDGLGQQIEPVVGEDGTFTVVTVHHFWVEVVPAAPEPQGGDPSYPLPFTVRVEARDPSDLLVPDYEGTANLTASCCANDPVSIGFTAGVWEGLVRLFCDLDPDCTLTVEDPGLPASGSSELFPVRGKGDVDGNSVVNVLDVVRTVRIALALPVPEPPRYEFQFWAANMNSDDWVNVLDVVLVVNKSLGRIGTLGQVTALGGGPVELSLVKEGRDVWVVRVSNAAGLAGAQLEIAGGQAEVSLGELLAGAGWQVGSNRVQGRLRVIAYSPAAQGLSVGEGTLLRLTGVRGRPRLMGVVLSDSAGREVASVVGRGGR